MAVITKGYTFGADICGGCDKKNKNWMRKNFHNKKCAEKFVIKMNKLYDKIRIDGNGNIPSTSYRAGRLILQGSQPCQIHGQSI